jgi:molecular chaperone GrpE
MSGDKSISTEKEVFEEEEGAEKKEGVQEEDAEIEETEASGKEAEEDPAEMLKTARAEAQENYDRFLRAVAELDNYRKRTAKIRTETREDLLRDVLLQIAPILDNLSRALGQESQEGDGLKQGIELIFNQFKEVLKGYGLEEIEAEGKLFDPNVHEALMELKSEEHPAGTVMEVMEKGYTLNKKIVRPARVIVSKVEE